MIEREIILQDKKITVIDGAISPNEILKALAVCTEAPLVRKGTSNVGEMNTQHYVSKGPLDILKQSAVFRMAESVVKKHYLKEPKCYRVIYREIVFGDHTAYHYDSLEGAVTAMVYLNDSWEDNYHGETLFLDEAGIGHCVMPAPGRLLVFDATLKHSSSAPSRTYFGARQILVFNFSEAESD